MTAQKKKPVINLLPKSDFDTTTTGRVLKWILGTFRMIVISVELVVISGFLSRFWLDLQNSDLSDEIKQKEALILSYTNFENTFRHTQKKLEIYSSQIKLNYPSSRLIADVTSYMSPSLRLMSLSRNGEKVSIEGIGVSESDISAFVRNLESSSAFTSVSLNLAEFDSKTQQIKFSLSLVTKN